MVPSAVMSVITADPEVPFANFISDFSFLNNLALLIYTFRSLNSCNITNWIMSALTSPEALAELFLFFIFAQFPPPRIPVLTLVNDP